MKHIKKYIRYTPPLIIILVQLAFYCSCPEIGVLGDDSSSYIDYAFTLQGIGGTRVPLYPLVLRICRILFGESRYLFFTACVQILISALSVFILYKTLRLATDNLLLSDIIAVLYGCNSCIMNWNIAIWSESLSISVTVFFLYAIVKYVKSPSFKNGTAAILLSLIAAGVKPTLAVYSGLCLVLLVLQFFTEKSLRRMIGKLSAVLGAVILIYAGYSYNNWVWSGTFNLTNLGPRHSLVPCLLTGCYLNYPDEELTSEITRVFNDCLAAGDDGRGWATTTPVMELFGANLREQNINVSEFTSYCLRTDPMAYLRYQYGNISTYWSKPYSRIIFPDILQYAPNPLFKILLFMQRDLPVFTVGSGFYMMALCLFLTLYQWIRTKRCPYFYLGVWGAITVIEASVFLGSYNAFARLSVYILPFLYFGCALILEDIIRCIQRQALREAASHTAA